jgi:hypothetical protein
MFSSFACFVLFISLFGADNNAIETSQVKEEFLPSRPLENKVEFISLPPLESCSSQVVKIRSDLIFIHLLMVESYLAYMEMSLDVEMQSALKPIRQTVNDVLLEAKILLGATKKQLPNEDLSDYCYIQEDIDMYLELMNSDCEYSSLQNQIDIMAENCRKIQVSTP